MNATKDEAAIGGRYPKAVWEEYRQKNREGSEVFREYLESLMEQKGIQSIEELHERFLATGYRIPIPGRHRDKPVKLEEFRLHCARAYPSAEEPELYTSFLVGLEEALHLTDEEIRDLFYIAMWGRPPKA